MIKKWQEKGKEKSEKFKQMEEDYRLNKMLEDRQKSSNERELERHYKKQREAEIKAELDIIRKRQTKEAWKGKSILKGQKSILTDDKSILTNNKKLLQNKSTFLNSHPSKLVKQEMFFKW